MSNRRSPILIIAVILLVLLFLPVLLLSMIPALAFGSNGLLTSADDVLTNPEAITRNIDAAIGEITTVMQHQQENVLSDISEETKKIDLKDTYSIKNADWTLSKEDGIQIISQFCISTNNHNEVNLAKLSSVLQHHADQLVSYSVISSSRDVLLDKNSNKATTITHYEYVIDYSDARFFAEQIFHLTDRQLMLAADYADNLTLFLQESIMETNTNQQGGTD